jgi:two-component system chemotaxis sensor kinase CheA
MTDPYRYFRIEARELVDALATGLSGLVRGSAPTAELVGGVLRSAHTLKGAARVVALVSIADSAHSLEELLEPYRGSAAPIAEDRLDQMQALVDEINTVVAALEGEPSPVPTLVPSPDQVGATVQTARTSLAEIDTVIEGVLQARAQLGALRENVERIVRFRARLHDVPGPRKEDRLKQIENLETAAEEVQRSLAASTDRLERELRQVHDTAERLRLVPVESIVPDLERGARDVAAAQGKRVLVDVVGGRIRVDAPVLATAQAALRQIVRNAVAHGIEAPQERLAAGKAAVGRIRIDVTHRAGTVVFSCTDDGRGIDLTAVRRELRLAGLTGPEPLDDVEVLDLLTLGGVSTASTISEISGRGIGLDVVRDAARQLGGRVSIRTVAGAGTTIDLTSPLSLSAEDVVLTDAGDLVGLPLRAVRETVRITAAELTHGQQGQTLIHRGQVYPFLPLATALAGEHAGVATGGLAAPAWSVLLLEGAAGSAAIGVRRLIGTAAVAIHAIPDLAPVSPLVAGVWIDVDGRPRLVLDAEALITAATGHRSLAPALPGRPRPPILIVDDSLTTRMLEQSILEAAGYEVELASSAEEGLRLATGRPFSLVLVDVEMPGMDGFAFVEQTRARPELRHLPCVLVTSRASEGDRRRGVAAGARGHLNKGEFYQGALLDLITELLTA